MVVQLIELLVSGFHLLFLSFPPSMQPNPSVGALEAVIGEELSLGGALEPAEADFEVCVTYGIIYHHLEIFHCL
jgi:hypothetical protein